MAGYKDMLIKVKEFRHIHRTVLARREHDAAAAAVREQLAEELAAFISELRTGTTQDYNAASTPPSTSLSRTSSQPCTTLASARASNALRERSQNENPAKAGHDILSEHDATKTNQSRLARKSLREKKDSTVPVLSALSQAASCKRNTRQLRGERAVTGDTGTSKPVVDESAPSTVADDVPVMSIATARGEEGSCVRLTIKEPYLDEFPRLLSQARSLGADNLGVFVIHLSGDVSAQYALLPGHPTIGQRKAHTFKMSRQVDRTYAFRMESEKCKLQKNPHHDFDGIHEDPSSLIERFESILDSQEFPEQVKYWVDLDANTEHDRAALRLPPASPIHPLGGDRLGETKAEIPGIHWPYAYLSDSPFGAPFLIHKEDFNLMSANYLYIGTKLWIVVSPDHTELLEGKLEQSPQYTTTCAQFVRHTPTYIPCKLLDQWGIKYTVILQRKGDIIVTLPRTYHQGFSVGTTLAEAVNYAPDDWDQKGYSACKPMKCPEPLIPAEEMDTSRTPRSTQRHQRGAKQDGAKAKRTKDKPRNDSEAIHVHNDTHQTSQTEPPTRSLEGTHGFSHKRKCDAPVAPSWTEKKAKRATSVLHAFSMEGGFEVPKHVVQRDKVHEIFRSKGIEEHDVIFLAKMFYAVASPDVFCGLRDACDLARKTGPDRFGPTETISQTLQMIGRLGNRKNMSAILIRYYLAQLYRKHLDYRVNYMHTKREGLRQKQSLELDRADTAALAKIMSDVHPELKKDITEDACKYNKALKALKNTLQLARPWHALSDHFTDPILALIPQEGTPYFQILNKGTQELFTTVLIEQRGSFLREVCTRLKNLFTLLCQGTGDYKFQFETGDEMDSDQVSMDSQSLLKLCDEV